MARTKKQKKNEKGEGTFRQRSNGTFEYRIVYTDEYNETKRKSFYGHTDIHITLDTYADVFNSMHNDSITKLGNYINNLDKVS